MKKYFISILACTVLTLSANAQELLKQCEDGIYKQTEYKINDMMVEEYPFEVYKILHTDQNSRNTYVFHMDLFETIKEGMNIPVFLLRKCDLDVTEADKNSFTNKWICDMSAHKTIKYGEVVNEYYNKKYKPSEGLKKLRKVFTENAKKNNKYHGIWKLSTDNSVTYKIYGNKHRISVTITNESAMGSVDTFEIKEGYTLENGTPCYFSWITPDSYRLSYYLNNKVSYEYYKRSNLKDFETDLLRIFGMKPCFVR